MTDTGNTPKKDALKLSSPSTLSLTKTVEGGQGEAELPTRSQQNGHGGSEKNPHLHQPPRHRRHGRSRRAAQSDATKQRLLNQAERESRLRALQQSREMRMKIMRSESRDVQQFRTRRRRSVKPTMHYASRRRSRQSRCRGAGSVPARHHPGAPRLKISRRVTSRRLRNAPSNRPAGAPAAQSGNGQSPSCVWRTGRTAGGG